MGRCSRSGVCAGERGDGTAPAGLGTGAEPRAGRSGAASSGQGCLAHGSVPAWGTKRSGAAPERKAPRKGQAAVRAVRQRGWWKRPGSVASNRNYRMAKPKPLPLLFESSFIRSEGCFCFSTPAPRNRDALPWAGWPWKMQLAALLNVLCLLTGLGVFI